jgi:hypothetical protein
MPQDISFERHNPAESRRPLHTETAFGFTVTPPPPAWRHSTSKEAWLKLLKSKDGHTPTGRKLKGWLPAKRRALLSSFEIVRWRHECRHFLLRAGARMTPSFQLTTKPGTPSGCFSREIVEDIPAFRRGARKDKNISPISLEKFPDFDRPSE